ncbi:ClbS/DfsB family four-helix bundle protein [bacterium 19CA06SA08-2]|uniref:ClbS/DfsB family four-helix bundle protein n=1 Tax=bacterium 19CA06SA08-2 TaxID=2920658 RepID=A0AAU6U6F9_UNCXX|nr:ClbS/DfsB family four-helix bundle protein [Aeromonas salmonicida]MDM5151599.1 ClbS/DfsB family four-helix bundle protein [Aeromonas salmonicida]
MGIPQDKAELLLAIDTNFGKLLKALQAVPESKAQELAMEGRSKGTSMSVANLVAYLIGWNELVIKWIERDAAGLPVDFPETGFKWNELGRLAQKFYRDYEGLAYSALLARLMAARARIVELIVTRGDDELYGRPWYEQWTLGRMIQFNTTSPYHNANGRLRKWLKGNGIRV